MAINTERSAVVGVFEDRAPAERAIEDLRRAGFRDDQIGIVTPSGEVAAGGPAGSPPETDTGGGAATGAVTGGVLGGILGAAASLLIPGLGPVLAGGILAATLGGAAIGAAAGGLLGALTGMGIPEEEARYYEREFRSGRTIVTVQANGRYQEARDILRFYGAYDADAQPGTAPVTEPAAVQPAAAPGTAAGRADIPSEVGTPIGDTQTMALREEQLRARKEMVQTGEIEIRKEVVTEIRTIEVPVTREVIVIQRHTVDRQSGTRSADRVEEINISDLRPGESLRIPVMEEEVTIEKRPVVIEQISVGKRQIQETREFSDTIRREEARIEPAGNVIVQGGGMAGQSGTGRWEDVMPQYRANWQQRYGSRGGRWEEYEPGYRYGWEMASQPRYRGRSWSEVEPDLRRDWEARHRDKSWDRAADAIRDAWESVTR